VLPLPLK
jgi:hypothetical protein